MNETVVALPALTPNQGGSATTTQMAAEVLAAYRNQS